jgi:hypothetical protein
MQLSTSLLNASPKCRLNFILLENIVLTVLVSFQRTLLRLSAPLPHSSSAARRCLRALSRRESRDLVKRTPD